MALLHPLLLKEISAAVNTAPPPRQKPADLDANQLIFACVRRSRGQISKVLRAQKKVIKTLQKDRDEKLPGIMKAYFAIYGKKPQTREEIARAKIFRQLIVEAQAGLPEDERNTLDLALLEQPFRALNADRVRKLFLLFEKELDEKARYARTVLSHMPKLPNPDKGKAGQGKPVGSRRAVLGSFIAGAVSGVLGDEIVHPRQWPVVHEIAQRLGLTEELADPYAKLDDCEIPQNPTPFEIVLSEKPLDRKAVARHLLENRFAWVGKEEDEFRNRTQRVHHFVPISETSPPDTGFQLATTINTLLDAKRLSPRQIANWIAWMHKKSFGMTLDLARIRVIKNDANKVEDIRYDLPSRLEDQRLLLPTKHNPTHDIPVPIELMPRDRYFLFKSGGGLLLFASDLAERIKKLKEIEAIEAAKPAQQSYLFGSKQPYRPLAPYVIHNDPMIKAIADELLKNIPIEEQSTRVLTLANFVRQLTLCSPCDVDRRRTGLLTLFNGGGDSGDLAILFAELMLAAGYPTALMQSGTRQNGEHVTAAGAAPEAFFPGVKKYEAWSTEQGVAKDSWWVEIDLTSVLPPGIPFREEDKNTDVFSVEVL